MRTWQPGKNRAKAGQGPKLQQVKGGRESWDNPRSSPPTCRLHSLRLPLAGLTKPLVIFPSTPVPAPLFFGSFWAPPLICCHYHLHQWQIEWANLKVACSSTGVCQELAEERQREKRPLSSSSPFANVVAFCLIIKTQTRCDYVGSDI